MIPIRTIVFDFDGTLANTQEAIRQSFVETLQDINAPIPLEPYLDEISCHSLEGMFRQLGVMDQECVDEAVSKYCLRYRAIAPRKARLFSGVSDTLETLRELDFTLAIGTNEVRENLEALFPSLAIHKYFHMSVCQDEVFLPKPHPEMLVKIIKQTGASPSGTLMVGDSVLDIAVGKATGCHTCAVSYGSHSLDRLRAHSPDWIIHQPTDLLSILGLPPLPGNLSVQERLAQGYSQ
jgi:HAD superfamily hydrolase (TIGR01549 family)